MLFSFRGCELLQTFKLLVSLLNPIWLCFTFWQDWCRTGFFLVSTLVRSCGPESGEVVLTGG